MPPSPLTRLPHADGKAPTLWKYDLWHTLHLGVSKSFTASMLALYSATFEGRSKERKFELLSQHFLAWCRKHGRPPIITKVTLIGWGVETTYPMGIWYKGGLSTLFCDYLEDVSAGQQFEEDLLNTCRDAMKSLNAFVRGLYRSEAFLDASAATHLGELGLQFLRRYAWLAKESVQRGRCLFSLIPKLHCLHHICLEDLLQASKTSPMVVNPLCYSVQQSEDYIGRNSRTSRRVHPRQVATRTLQRHLKLAHSHVKAVLIVRGS